jgi:hypothetical protein
MSSPLGDEVPAGGPPRGARANAVPAPAAWAGLTEVDRRVAQPLLDSLEDAGVAAYAEPLVAPGDATERLYVDAAQRDVAEAVVGAELPGLLAELGPAAEIDPFDAIVAGWDAVPEAATWPAEEDVRPARREPDVGPPRSAPAARPSRRPEEDHFVPPTPPPAPPAQPVTRYAVLAVCLGLFVLIGLPLLGTAPSHVASVLGAVSLLAGLGTLVWRMRDAPSVDDGPDDGAVL